MWIKWLNLDCRIQSHGGEIAIQREVSLKILRLVLVLKLCPLLVEIVGRFKYLELLYPLQTPSLFCSLIFTYIKSKFVDITS